VTEYIDIDIEHDDFLTLAGAGGYLHSAAADDVGLEYQGLTLLASYFHHFNL